MADVTSDNYAAAIDSLNNVGYCAAIRELNYKECGGRTNRPRAWFFAANRSQCGISSEEGFQLAKSVCDTAAKMKGVKPGCKLDRFLLSNKHEYIKDEFQRASKASRGGDADGGGGKDAQQTKYIWVQRSWAS